ncbi:MAG TPA: lysylphosphatidylglycerol synthase domain-containing protein [Flavobacteriales bacterium]|nr:lysylphosphatidylglycerol synthase domain-containing protein [Flavobacteriales bacterium]
MSARRSLLMLFRWVIFLLACVFLYVELAGPKGIAVTDGRRVWDLLLTNRLVLLAIGALMLVNWWVESYKWRRLIHAVEPVGPWRAFVATIAGTSVGFVSVNRTGEFIGRVLFLEPENRIAGSFATALGSIAQFVVTLAVGGLGLLVITALQLPLPWPQGWTSWVLATLTTLVTGIALVLYLYPGLFRQLLLLVPFLNRFERASAVLSHFQRSDLLSVHLLSGTRYGLFTFQFVLLLYVFGSGLHVFHAMLGVPLIYLIATLIPSVMLTELGVRGSVAVAILVPLGGDAAVVVLATTCLWLINVALPACVGSLILLFARIRIRNTTA